MVDSNDKPGVHSSLEDESASDGELRGTVEVTFDPGKSHRRKSSMGHHPAPLRMPPSERKSECIVHQFFERQKRTEKASRAADADSDAGPYDDETPSQRTARDHRQTAARESAEESRDAPSAQGDDVAVNGDNRQDATIPVRRQSRIGLLEPVYAEDRGKGQADQLSWGREMAKTLSEVEMEAAAREQGYDGGSEIHTRLLTRKELSDMAWGVRELSRRLGNMRIKPQIKSIFILTKIHDQDLIYRTRELARWLLSRDRPVRYTIYVEDLLRENKRFDAHGLVEELRSEYVTSGELPEEVSADAIKKRLRYWSEHVCRLRPHTFDLIITLGGDGTVLFASWLFQRIVPPVLSFALGSLGFLTKFDFEDYQQTLTQCFTKGLTVSLRLRFEGTVMRSKARRASDGVDGDAPSSSDDGAARRDLVEELIGEEKDDDYTHRPEGTYEILNEIVIDRGPNPTMSITEIFGDDEHFTTVQADGICVSTPTGSTAYNLATGGSLCHPENPIMLVTAICAHTLSFRPIILPDTIVLRLGVPYDSRTNSWASFDGRKRIELFPGDYVTVSASRYPFAMVQTNGRRSEDWVKSISGKLGWNTRQRQKGFKDWEKL